MRSGSSRGVAEASGPRRPRELLGAPPLRAPPPAALAGSATAACSAAEAAASAASVAASVAMQAVQRSAVGSLPSPQLGQSSSSRRQRPQRWPAE